MESVILKIIIRGNDIGIMTGVQICCGFLEKNILCSLYY